VTPRIHHIALTTADLDRAAIGYDAVLGVLGYRRTITADTLLGWGGQQPEILIYPVEGDDLTPHRHGRPGLQHLAFEVADQATVNAAGTAAIDNGWTVVHPPQFYDYADGYYAVFLDDPDGSRIEVAHIPTATS
jgi:catechol 2,3-dioxygenase-like lactoylglutathione lyase family enzyme